MELSKRLQAVACAVRPGNRVADVGTDHGYVPIWLVEEGLSPEAIASDVREGPLQRARDHIREHGLEDRIHTRLGSGLASIEPEEVDTVIMAGMGGDLMARLLAEAPAFFREGKEMILQPQSEWFKVRYLLHDQGYRIDEEWMVAEEGHYYTVIRGLPGKEAYDSEWDYRYGKCLMDRKDPVLSDYLTRECRKNQEILDKLQNIKKSDASAHRISQISDEIEWMKSYLFRAGR